MSRSALEAQIAGKRGGSFLSQKIDEKKRLQESISSHKTGLPDRLLRLFAPRPPIPHIKPKNRRPVPAVPMSGVAALVEQFKGPEDPEYEPPPPETRPPEPRLFRNPELATQARVDIESKPEKDVRITHEKKEAARQAVEEGIKAWDPAKDPNAEGDPFKTLFVGRLSYEVTERKLRREFEEYGPIKRIRLVHDKNSGKPRGYAFIEYEHKNDMKQAYKMADGRKIEGKRVLVDVERGRTVPNWRPRRLGGGTGGEGREAKLPKDVRKAFEKRVVLRWLEEKERLARGREERREERRRERSRSRDREEGEVGAGARRERSKERDDRHRDRRDSGRGDRDRDRKRERTDDDRDERRDRDKRPRERDL